MKSDVKDESPDIQLEAEAWINYGAIEVKIAIEPREL